MKRGIQSSFTRRAKSKTPNGEFTPSGSYGIVGYRLCTMPRDARGANTDMGGGKVLYYRPLYGSRMEPLESCTSVCPFFNFNFNVYMLHPAGIPILWPSIGYNVLLNSYCKLSVSGRRSTGFIDGIIAYSMHTSNSTAGQDIKGEKRGSGL